MSTDDIPDVAPEYAPSNETDWESVGRALPETLDPVMTKALIQRYIETERHRNRRVLLWISGIFLFVVLLILVMFISIGVVVLKKSVSAADTAEKMTLQTSAYAAEVVGMSNKLGLLERNTEGIKSLVDEKEMLAKKKQKILQSDLKRFSAWVSKKNKSEKDAIILMEGKIKELEATSAIRQKELEQIRVKYAAVMEVAAGMGAQAFTMASVASEKDEPDDVVTTVLSEKDTASDGATVASASTSQGKTARLSAGAVSVVSFPDGDRYRGSFKGGLFHGWGVYTYASGDRYEGDFESDMKSGSGTLFFANGDKYVGRFKNDMQNGQGTFYISDGERYVGAFVNSRMTGKGTRFYNSGNKYEGDFRNDLRHGNGILTFQNGDIYKGELRDDKRTGKGTYIFTDGARYIGDFDDGRRHGRGRYIYSGGEEFIGEFRDGKREGVGLCIYPNGQQLNGLWKNDEFVRVIEK